MGRQAVILAGGGGSRLWPASRRARPKQLLRLGPTSETLLGATVRRAQALADRTVVVTGARHELATRAVLGADAELLVEPLGRNTAAAVGLAAVHALARDPDAVLIALPADHVITDEPAFARTVVLALDCAADTDQLVCIGVSPTRPETGYGYIEVGAARPDGAREVVRFVEKPDLAAAGAMFASGAFLWNAGILAGRAARILDELRQHMPDTHQALLEIGRTLAAGGDAAAAVRAAELYPALPALSIDHGILERARDLLCVPGDFGWNDVGAWSALEAGDTRDAAGNTGVGHLVALDAHRNVAVSDPEHVVVLVGVHDLVVVQSGDAVLVVPRARAQEVRAVLDALERTGLERFL